MTRLVLVGATILTLIIIGIGYALEALDTFLAVWFDLPGPYSNEPEAWIWFALNLSIVFGIAFLFCRWLARRAQAKAMVDKVFE